MSVGLALACLAPLSPSVPRAVGPKPSLAARANRAINGLPEHAVVPHLLSMVQAGNNGF